MENLYTGVLLRIAVTNGRSVIGGAIINYNSLKITESLAANTIKALRQIDTYIIDRNDNWESGHCYFLDLSRERLNWLSILSIPIWKNTGFIVAKNFERRETGKYFLCSAYMSILSRSAKKASLVALNLTRCVAFIPSRLIVFSKTTCFCAKSACDDFNICFRKDGAGCLYICFNKCLGITC